MQNTKKDFKIFENYKNKNNSVLTYLDTAASSLTPKVVTDKLLEYYEEYRSNIDRGLYKTAIEATSEYDAVRIKTAKFIGAETDDIIFTSGSTSASNMLVNLIEKHIDEYRDSSGVNLYLEKDEILVSVYAHHSDLVPLQEYANRNNLKIKLISPEESVESGENSKSYFDKFTSSINEKTLLISHPLVSNVSGEIFDIESLSTEAKKVKAFFISDMTSAAGHIEINVKDLGIHAGYFGGHKMCGPTGVGVLYIDRNFSRAMSPVSFGGGMVWEVNDETSNYRSDVKAFEAGTSSIADVIAFGAAIDYLNTILLVNIQEHVKGLVEYAKTEIQKNFADKVNVYAAETDHNAGILSFDYKGVHPHDVAEVLSRDSVCVRAGHHCAQPLMRHYGVTALSRISFYIYNDKTDIDNFINSLKKVVEVFKK